MGEVCYLNSVLFDNRICWIHTDDKRVLKMPKTNEKERKEWQRDYYQRKGKEVQRKKRASLEENEKLKQRCEF